MISTAVVLAMITNAPEQAVEDDEVTLLLVIDDMEDREDRRGKTTNKQPPWNCFKYFF